MNCLAINKPNEKELQIHLQKEITSYLYISLPLCAILSNSKNYDWLLNHFIQLYTLYTSGQEFWLDYLEERDFYNEITECYFFNSNSNEAKSDIVNYIKQNIEDKFYTIIYLDEYYLLGKDSYNKKHFLHANMIYGYDNINQVFKTIGFDNRQNFTIQSYAFSDIKSAYDNGKNYYSISPPWVTKETIEIIRPKEFEFKTSIIRDNIKLQLSMFLSGKSSLSLRPQNIEHFGSNANYNIDIYNTIIEFLSSQDIKTYNYIQFYLLYEHKDMMQKRLKRIKETYISSKEFDVLCNQYDNIVEQILTLRNIFFKEKARYDITHTPYIINKVANEKMIKIINDVRESEYRILSKTISML